MVLYMSYQRRLHSKSTLGNGLADQTAIRKVGTAQRLHDKRVLSGIIFINRNGLRSRDAPADYGPHKTLYSRWKRWSEKGIFAQMLLELADRSGGTATLMIPSRRHASPDGRGMQLTSRRTHCPAMHVYMHEGARPPAWG